MPENSTDVKVGTLIALMVDEGDDWQNVEVPADAGAPPPSPAASESPSPASVISAPPPTTSSTGSHSSSHLLGPAVKNYLKQYGLDSGSISGSGPKGTVTKGDVLRHVQTKNIAPVVIGELQVHGSYQPLINEVNWLYLSSELCYFRCFCSRFCSWGKRIEI